MTVPTLGLITAFVDGSRLFWASLSPVHERLGYRVSHPDRIQGDAVISAFVNHGPVQVCASLVLRPIVPTLQPRAVLAVVKAWPGEDTACRSRATTASLDDRLCAALGATGKVGTKKRLGRTKKPPCRLDALPREFAAMP